MLHGLETESYHLLGSFARHPGGIPATVRHRDIGYKATNYWPKVSSINFQTHHFTFLFFEQTFVKFLL